MAAGSGWRGFGKPEPAWADTSQDGDDLAGGPGSQTRQAPRVPRPSGQTGPSAPMFAHRTPPHRWLPRRLLGRRLGRLEWALLVSMGLHAGLLVFRLADPVRFERVFRDSPLEVILVNARADDAPLKAQALAQTTLAGGGSLDSGRATSPLPAMQQVELGDAPADTHRKVDQLRQQQQQLLAQVRREMALLPPPDAQRDAGTPQAQDQEERRRQLLKLLAEIEKRINDDNAQPRKRYVSPATREATYAVYYDQLRRRIEERGTLDFPENAGKKLYGELTMNITVNAQGRLVEADVVKNSPSRLLDRRALAIVHAAAPFGQFNAAMKNQADEIVVTARFRFTRDEGLATTLSATPP